MNHSSDNYNFGHNFLLPNRLALKTSQSDFHRGKITFGKLAEAGDGKKTKEYDDKDGQKSNAESEKTSDSTKDKRIDTLKKQIEISREKNNQRIVITETNRNKFKKKMGREIYGGDEELREKYRKSVRKAIEIMDRDSLYDFIKNHTPPKQSYEKGSYEQWNNDFSNLITPNMPKEYSSFKTSDSETENRYLVGGLQQYLLDEFDTDVFQATSKHKNPFIHVDGRLGVYTISVMSAHWNKEFLPKDEKQRPELAYGALGNDYSKRNEIMYGNALTHLNTQLTVASLSQNNRSGVKLAEAEESEPSQKTGANTMEAIRKDLLDSNASDGAIYAFDSAYDPDFIPAIRKIIKELKDEGVFKRRSSEAWDEVHNRLISKNSPHFSQAYFDEYAEYEAENPDTTPTPAPVPETPDKTKLAKKETSKKNAEKLTKEDFIRGLRARINREDFDFNLWTWDEEAHREEFANKIYNLCNEYKIPLTTAVLDDVIESLKIYSTDGKSVDYGRKLFRLTDTQVAAQKTENRKLISYLGRGLREKYLEEELPEEDDELMNKDDFIAEVITELDANDVDFQSWGFEYNAREAFAKDAYKKCKESKIPTSMNTVRHMVDKLIYEYMVTDNDIEYYSDTTNRTEIASNNKILDEITEGIA